MITGESYKDSEGNDKSRWRNCGVGFVKESGDISCKMAVIPLSGRFMLVPKKKKEDDGVPF